MLVNLLLRYTGKGSAPQFISFRLTQILH